MNSIILTSDDFGLFQETIYAVLQAYNHSLLRSCSVCSNGKFFDQAVDVISQCPNLGVGVHLNVMEGRSITHPTTLVDSSSRFNKGYLYYLAHQFDSKVLSDLYQEFDSQINLVKSRLSVLGRNIDHLDSHVHIHSIPSIFDIVCRLAKKHNIPYIRTWNEPIYLTFQGPNKTKLINLVKLVVLRSFFMINRSKLCKYHLKTNTHLLGITYTGMMSKDNILKELSIIKENKEPDSFTEIIIHPRIYTHKTVNHHTREFDLTIDQDFQSSIKDLGYLITNYQDLELKFKG